MNPGSIPSFQEVLHDLKDVTPVFYGAVEAAISATREWFELDSRPPDPYLASHMVRYFAKLELQKYPALLQIDEIANTGLSVRHRGYHIRILKSDEGELPAPGESVSRQAFYQQEQLDMEDQNPGMVFLNLIVLWNTTFKFDLAELTMACPKGGDSSKASVEAHWHQPIPHAALVVTQQEMQVDAADDLDEMKLRDKADTGSHGS